MATITVQEAQLNLDRYLDRVAKGETLIVTRDGTPMAEIRPVPMQISPRSIGLAKGTFEVPDRFFDPLPAEIIDAFNGHGS